MNDDIDPTAAQRAGRLGLGGFFRGATGLLSKVPGLRALVIDRDAAAAEAAAELARVVIVPILADPPAHAEWREIERGFASLAEESLWMSLLDRMRGVDQTRQEFGSGRRYFDCALAGALAPVTRHLGRRPNLEAALDALPQLAALHAANTRDYMPGVLLARAQIEIGWAIRGPSPPHLVTPNAASSAAIYFARAEAAIEAFDPIEVNSPMVAEARYRLAPGMEDGAEYLRDWYEDWADLDPSNPHMLATHSRLLMPDWYGDLDEIEAEARRAVIRAKDGLGAGAYPLFWRAPLEADPGVLGRIDPDLFLEGVHSALTRADNQDLANEFVALLYRLALPRSSETREEGALAAPVRERMAQGFVEVVERHLKEIHLPVWGMDETTTRQALAEVFRSEIDDGAILTAGERGIEAVMPMADPEPSSES